MGFFGGGGDDQGGGIPLNAGTRNALMCVVSGYIIYLGVSIIKGYLAGEPGMPGWLAILFGVLFILIGAAYFVYNVRSYIKIMKMAQESSDDESQEDDTLEMNYAEGRSEDETSSEEYASAAGLPGEDDN